MRAWIVASSIAASACSLIVPNPADYTPDLADAGQGREDAGRDAGRDGGMDAGRDAGVDGGPSCDPTLTACDGECVDTETSLEHCGGCGNACASTDECRAGECFDPAVEVAAGPEHTCARRASGEVWCWGSNIDGQLGDGTVIDSPVPVLVVDLSTSVQVTAGGYTWRAGNGLSCARAPDGAVRCWGANESGQLGDGTTTSSSRPLLVSGLPAAREIAAGFDETCAVTTARQLYCWGRTASAPRELTPLSVGGAWAGTLDLSATHGCIAGASSEGEIYCWGSNFNGQLGDGTTTDRDRPTRVAELTGAIDVSASSASCAVLATGSVRCWGLGRALGAGRTDMDPQTTPVPVTGLDDALEIDGAPFGATTCAIRGPDRRVACWGLDLIEGARTGSPIDAPAPVPVDIPGLTGVTSIAVGGFHACAIAPDGVVRCWGMNQYGQLGDGTTENRSELIEVRLP